MCKFIYLEKSPNNYESLTQICNSYILKNMGLGIVNCLKIAQKSPQIILAKIYNSYIYFVKHGNRDCQLLRNCLEKPPNNFWQKFVIDIFLETMGVVNCEFLLRKNWETLTQTCNFIYIFPKICGIVKIVQIYLEKTKISNSYIFKNR